MDSRGATPVVEKLLATGVVLLFVTGATGTLLGGVVPAHRAGAGGEIAERVLATAADRIEAATAGPAGQGRVVAELDVPRTIAGEPYDLVLEGERLHLRHPRPGVERTTSLSFPSWVKMDSSAVGSESEPGIVVRYLRRNLTVTLVEGSP